MIRRQVDAAYCTFHHTKNNSEEYSKRTGSLDQHFLIREVGKMLERVPHGKFIDLLWSAAIKLVVAALNPQDAVAILKRWWKWSVALSLCLSVPLALSRACSPPRSLSFYLSY